MSDKSAIEWTDATWNPTRGCTKVSAGCTNCYIVRTPPFRIAGRTFEGGAEGTDIGATTGVELFPDRLDQPLRWKRPRRIFVNSLSDLFHPDVPDEFIELVFATMAATPQHTYQILTKRPRRMLKWFQDDFLETRAQAVAGVSLDTPDGKRIVWDARPDKQGVKGDYDRRPFPGWPLPNVWLGVSVENQAAADLRIPLLLQTPAAIRFLSCEPLLGPVYLREEWLELELQAFGENGAACFQRIHWVIAGGESGPGARPMHPQWVRSIRDQCQHYWVPFFFKQWGEYRPFAEGDDLNAAQTIAAGDTSLATMIKLGKKGAGRMLDGREWNEFPGYVS